MKSVVGQVGISAHFFCSRRITLGPGRSATLASVPICVIKAIHVVQRRHNRFNRPASDSRDGLNSLDAFVVFGDQVQTAFDVGLLLGKGIELC